MITKDQMFNFIMWTVNNSYQVSQNKKHVNMYYRPSLHGGIEFITFTEAFNQFKKQHLIIIDNKKFIVNNIITQTELLRLAGISKQMEKNAKNVPAKTAGGGWQVWELIMTTSPDIKIKGTIELNSDKRVFYTGCENTYGG